MRQRPGLPTTDYLRQQIHYKPNTSGGCSTSTDAPQSSGLNGTSDRCAPPDSIQLHKMGHERWSTYILKRVWGLWGHMARAGEEVTAMVTWKNMNFWRAEQRKPRKHRVTHASRFNPEGDVERALESIAPSTLERALRRLRCPVWCAVATGKQASIVDNLHPRSARRTGGGPSPATDTTTRHSNQQPQPPGSSR